MNKVQDNIRRKEELKEENNGRKVKEEERKWRHGCGPLCPRPEKVSRVFM